ncbi:hypothetical protein WOLCODRAFT_159851 [Wolfiporia cocos MD-104 SS10]|uniref:Uncharacterized protein n=1 Tax=Wolfiporia cocos (strain MD-104) TaxID=742152 RepID=A0A2H3J305_WOLCO|nr:hypothetical protein WOLCODRAFT_159851 [Wolfiporia cocos MD-104 SS10]
MAALRHKPSHLSYAAYSLDLRTKFPLGDSSSVTEEGSWRERALALEEDLRKLQVKYGQEHSELLSLRDATPILDTRGESATTSAVKRKQKKKNVLPLTHPESLRQTFNFKSVLTGTSKDGYPQASSRSLVMQSLDALDTLSTARASSRSSTPDELFLVILMQAVDALGGLLVSLLSPGSALPSSNDTLAAICTLVERLLLQVVPLLTDSNHKSVPSKAEDPAIMGVFLGRLSSAILVPIMQSFAPLSNSYILTLLAPRGKTHKKSFKHQESEADIRPAVFAIIDRALAILDSLMTNSSTSTATQVQAAKHALTLEATRVLVQLFADPHAPNPGDGVPKPRQGVDVRLPLSQRLHKLARKDTIWYLCNTLHLVLPAPFVGTSVPTQTREQDVLLADAIYAALAELLQHAKVKLPATSPSTTDMANEVRRYDLDEVERGMVLAVIERAWLGR